MAEVKESLFVLIKLLAHSLMAALFVITIAVIGTATANALANLCGGQNHVLCRAIWFALEVPFLLGIVFVVISQVLNQADEFFSTLRKAIRSIGQALRGIRKDIASHGKEGNTRKKTERRRLEKALGPKSVDAVPQPENNNEAA